MTYRIEFEFSPLYELVNSLEIFIFRKSVKSMDLGTEWIKEIEKKASAQNVEFGNKKNIPSFRYLYLLIWQSPVKEDVASFVKWLRSLEPGKLYEMLFSYVSEPLPNDLYAVMETYSELIQKWNSIYFQHIDPSMIDNLRKSKSSWEERCHKDKDPISLVEQVSGGVKINPYEGLQQIILTPTFHSSPLVTTHKCKRIIHVMYPVDMPENSRYQPSKKLSRMTKALADDNRLRIIKYLYEEGPKTFSEILNHFDLSNSTVHHHVMTLRAAGLVSIYHVSECCNELYIYRPSSILELTQSFEGYIQS